MGRAAQVEYTRGGIYPVRHVRPLKPFREYPNRRENKDKSGRLGRGSETLKQPGQEAGKDYPEDSVLMHELL